MRRSSVSNKYPRELRCALRDFEQFQRVRRMLDPKLPSQRAYHQKSQPSPATLWIRHKIDVVFGIPRKYAPRQDSSKSRFQQGRRVGAAPQQADRSPAARGQRSISIRQKKYHDKKESRVKRYPGPVPHHAERNKQWGRDIASPIEAVKAT